ncbi:hypothetical protein ACH46N_21425 [Streptomyces pristinaespiralis]|jgi:hypothetical protein|nr:MULTISPECIES: hypothetical protein [Streptomyces]ALC21316.1 hypothetical protein SPRI_3010 [Streptomyces pristinaespiralis]QIP85016.1 hypothetical protein GLX30_14400 [Streptomyces sp. Tu 2975]QMU15949.1 hypothetical protein H3L99_21980 [Streptomyces pristinaespiralis]
MYDHSEADDCAEELRAVLAEHGITLPSLRVDLPTFAARYPARPLISLGNCNLLTARTLVAALRKGVA